jgi:hypothetical protein
LLIELTGQPLEGLPINIRPILFVEYVVLMIEIVERLRQLKGVPCYVRRLSAGDRALDGVVCL